MSRAIYLLVAILLTALLIVGCAHRRPKPHRPMPHVYMDAVPAAPNGTERGR